MRIGVFYQNDTYSQMAGLMLDSVRKVMPDVEIHHLADGKCTALKGADAVHRIPEPMPMAVRRMTLQSQCEGDWLFMDADVIAQKDVSHVFDDKDFDVALTNRDGTITNEAKYAAVMPYNTGVVFSRSPAFWKMVLHHLKNQPMQLQDWTGDQLVICEMMKQGAFGFKVKVLPGATYNYPPKFAGDGADAALAHFKGNRKAYLKEIA
jgi:Nucleotide-diphospho-sugar transferase